MGWGDSVRIIHNIEIFFIESNASSAEQSDSTRKSASIYSICEVENRVNTCCEGGETILNDIIGRISKSCTPIGDCNRLCCTLYKGISKRRSRDLIEFINCCEECRGSCISKGMLWNSVYLWIGYRVCHGSSTCSWLVLNWSCKCSKLVVI